MLVGIVAWSGIWDLGSEFSDCRILCDGAAVGESWEVITTKDTKSLEGNPKNIGP
jgi:hypothetical protein